MSQDHERVWIARLRSALAHALVVRAKTGNTTVGDERVSWLVGHVETQNRQFVFVSRVRAIQELPGTAGAELVSRRLNALGPARR